MRYTRNNDFVMREIAGEAFLIPVGNASVKFNGMITLNSVSAYIWKKLENPISKDELISAMLEDYEVEKEQVEKDVTEFLNMLKQLEMVNC